ncbi:hypothetical protein [Stenotrophomonas maltophilia group sp. CASM26]|uniref:hypothetical protein n=1 Tax=Stenotrophomonas maltophilia group sp. CASM26 TaxID=3111514 RepID=UPI003BF8F475
MAHISVQRKRAARQNIEIKLNLLRSWATHGIPVDETTGRLEYAPLTLRQFKAWDGSLNSVAMRKAMPVIHRIGSGTLDANLDLKRLASSLIKLLASSAVQPESGAPARATTPSTRDLEALLRLRNSEVVQQQREILRLKRHISTLERRLSLR